VSFIRSLMSWFRRTPPPLTYLVAMLEPGGATALAAFRRPEDARRFVVDEARRRVDLDRRAAEDEAAIFVRAYQQLNNSYRPGEFWSVVPVNLAPSQGAVPVSFNEELFDISEIGAHDATVASVTLPGLSIWEGEALTGADAFAPNPGIPPPDTVEQVHIAVEMLAEIDISCYAFADLAAIKRFTMMWHQEDHPTTEDFRDAFRELNTDDSAFSLSTVRLGRAQFTPIFNDRQRAEAAGEGIGFCALSDTRIGQSLTR
jgi:hypothetical protein